MLFSVLAVIQECSANLCSSQRRGESLQLTASWQIFVAHSFMAMFADLWHDSADEIPCMPKLAVAVLFKDAGVSQSNPDFVTKLVSSLDKKLNPIPKVRCKRGVERSGKS